MAKNGIINSTENISTSTNFCNISIDEFNDRCDNFNDRRDDLPIIPNNENTREPENDKFPFTIYRFKFEEDFVEELYKFAKIHQYDDRKDFKEAWKVWNGENENIINDEMRRLVNLGYEGDILDKMFKSARYYFRKKTTTKIEPRQRREYISVNRELLDKMDSHIESNIYDVNYQPKTGFISFCKDNENILRETIATFFDQGINETNLIKDKIKKTYKNRYFMFINKNKK
jgi:hypothetical protein